MVKNKAKAPTQTTLDRLLENAQLIRWVVLHARDLKPILRPAVARAIDILGWCEDQGTRSKFAIAGHFGLHAQTVSKYLRVLELAELIDRASSGEPSGLPVEVGGRPLVLAVLKVTGSGETLQLTVERLDPGAQIDLELEKPG